MRRGRVAIRRSRPGRISPTSGTTSIRGSRPSGAEGSGVISPRSWRCVASGRALAANQRCDHFVDRDCALASEGALVAKFYPALVESIEHLHSREWIGHALSAEDRFPFFARHRRRLDRFAEGFRERRRDLVLGGTL